MDQHHGYWISGRRLQEEVEQILNNNNNNNDDMRL